MIHIWTDGACDQTGTKAGGWATIIDEDGDLVHLSGNEPQTTNNRMELKAIIAALEVAVPAITEDVVVHTDSELIVKQRTGEYTIKNNKDLNSWLDAIVRSLKQIQGVDVIWQWHPRNSHAHLQWCDKQAKYEREQLDAGPMRRLKSKYNPQ